MRDSLDLVSDLRRMGPGRTRWVEVVVFSSAVPLLRVAFGCHDPFLWEAACPWLFLLPLLAGALHGALAALLSAGLLSGLLFADAAVVPQLAARWGLPCCALGVIAGRVADAERERVERLRRRIQQLTAALSRERTSRQVLQVSHRRLAARLPPPSSCLQASLDAVTARLVGSRSWPERGQLVLGVLAEHAAVQAASLFVVDQSGAALAESAVAQLGDTTAPARDLLVQRALRSGKLAMPAEPESLVAASAEVLAALPLVCRGRALAVVAIQQLPFEAFEPGHLQESMLLLAMLAAAIAESLLLTAPEQPEPLALEARWGGIA
jgi:hypothetical protein